MNTPTAFIPLVSWHYPIGWKRETKVNETGNESVSILAVRGENGQKWKRGGRSEGNDDPRFSFTLVSFFILLP